jgi:YfiH family protein
VIPETITPDWAAPAGVRALVTTRALGDVKTELARTRLRRLLPADPLWLQQVHGIGVVDASRATSGTEADAACSRTRGAVCAVMAADCMPVLLASEGVVGAAHAGWRGLSAGVIEATVAAMEAPARELVVWLGPAIGPRAYEVGEEVREAFLRHAGEAQSAFTPTRPGHWHLDLYAVARQRLAALGVTRVSGGDFCTAADPARFYSYRRDKASQRMAALVWLS